MNSWDLDPYGVDPCGLDPCGVDPDHHSLLATLRNEYRTNARIKQSLELITDSFVSWVTGLLGVKVPRGECEG